MEVTGYANDEDCRSPADNDKDHIKSELLFARQPDLAAAHTTVPSPLIFSTETARRSFETSIFSRKRPQTRERIGTVMVVPNVYELFDEKYYADLPGGILENFGRLLRTM
jgi:hypothetical protein